MRYATALTLVAAMAATPVLAQDAAVSSLLPRSDDPLIQAAVDSGACGETFVATAVLSPTGRIEVTCAADVVGFVPLLGGLGPTLAGTAIAAAVAAAVGGGGATPDTISP